MKSQKSGWWGLTKGSPEPDNTLAQKPVAQPDSAPSTSVEPASVQSQPPSATFSNPVQASQSNEVRQEEPRRPFQFLTNMNQNINSTPKETMTTYNSESEAYIPSGMEIEGTVKSDRPLKINGKIHGKVESSSQVVVGETGEVDADITCGKLEIYGRVNGEVSANEHVGLFKGGKLIGKINTPNLQTESGAFFKGVVEMTDGAGENGTAMFKRSEPSGAAASASGRNPFASTPKS
jgi:cytoskeletal protein CcmA (bactofilin family)